MLHASLELIWQSFHLGQHLHYSSCSSCTSGASCSFWIQIGRRLCPGPGLCRLSTCRLGKPSHFLKHYDILYFRMKEFTLETSGWLDFVFSVLALLDSWFKMNQWRKLSLHLDPERGLSLVVAHPDQERVGDSGNVPSSASRISLRQSSKRNTCQWRNHLYLFANTLIPMTDGDATMQLEWWHFLHSKSNWDQMLKTPGSLHPRPLKYCVTVATCTQEQHPTKKKYKTHANSKTIPWFSVCGWNEKKNAWSEPAPPPRSPPLDPLDDASAQQRRGGQDRPAKCVFGFVGQ